MRLVIKVGTQVITGKGGVDDARIKQISKEISELLGMGHEVVLVASGASQAGMEKLPNLHSPLKKKIWQSMGQPILMQKYATEFKNLGIHTGQVLILRNNFTSREGFENLLQTLDATLKAKVLPILNQNDPTETKNLTLGDNDILSAMIAVAISADKLIILTNQDGLYDQDPNKNPNAKLIKTVLDVDFEIEKLCSTEKSATGLGGMLSKVRATKHAVSSGVEVLIGNGATEGILKSALQKDFHGTKFTPKTMPKMNEKKRWMMSAKGTGIMIVDDGAVKALRSKKSLLLPGVTGVKGDFKRGEIVEIVSKSGQAVAYGKVNYPAKDIQSALAIKKQSKDEKGLRILEREVIHRDYMVMLSNN